MRFKRGDVLLIRRATDPRDLFNPAKASSL